MEINKVYIAGPISGIKDGNRKAFLSAERRLMGYQYIVVNPHKLDHSGNSKGKWDQYMKVCLTAMLECDGIVMLAGWDKSEGAQLEMRTAICVGMPVAFLADSKKEILFYSENQ